MRSITSSYDNRLKDVVSFFEEEGRPDQTVLVNDPEFPLIFHTDMRIIELRFATPDDLAALPDWVLSVSPSGVLEQPSVRPPGELITHYEIIRLEVHNSLRGGSRPDPRAREWFTATETTEMVVYKKNPAGRPAD
jgi:hypothetical protein